MFVCKPPFTLTFKQQFAESCPSWWETRGNRNELDIVALKLEKGPAVVAEVKRQMENFKPVLLASKTEHFKHKVLPDYTIETVCLSPVEM